MFCARCWSPVGPHDRTCSQCAADLTLPGSVRLTDPRRLSADHPRTPAHSAAHAASNSPGVAVASPPVPKAPGEPEVPVERRAQAPIAAPAAGAQPGPGWWHGLKGKLLEIGEKAAVANRARQARPAEEATAGAAAEGVGDAAPVGRPEPPAQEIAAVAAAPSKVVHGAHPASRPDRQVPHAKMAAAKPVHGATPVQRTDVPEPPIVEPAPAVRRPRADREPGELSLWDDYGMADTPNWPRIDHSLSRLQQLAQLVGATALPTAKSITFLSVLGGAVILLLWLVAQLLTLDALIVFPGRESAPPAPEPTSIATQPPEPEPTNQTPPAPVRHTPSMLPGAKECESGVWAGQQTSCALASSVAQQVRVDMTGTVIVEAFSSSSNRTYRLECVADEGITCTGLDGVEGVLVWFVTEG